MVWYQSGNQSRIVEGERGAHIIPKIATKDVIMARLATLEKGFEEVRILGAEGRCDILALQDRNEDLATSVDDIFKLLKEMMISATKHGEGPKSLGDVDVQGPRSGSNVSERVTTQDSLQTSVVEKLSTDKSKAPSIDGVMTLVEEPVLKSTTEPCKAGSGPITFLI